jgi:hypothetical protein
LYHFAKVAGSPQRRYFAQIRNLPKKRAIDRAQIRLCINFKPIA